MITQVTKLDRSFIFPESSMLPLDGLEESIYSYKGGNADSSKMEYRQLLSKDIYIGHQQIFLNAPVNFSLVRNTDLIQMIFVIKGNYELRSDTGTVVSLQSQEHNIVYLAGGRTEGLVKGNEELEFVEIQLALPFVERYISSDHELHLIITEARSAKLSARCMSVNAQMQGVLFDLVNCELEGNLKSLYVRAKVIELLSLQLAQYGSSNHLAENGLNSRDIEKMNKVRELITASPDTTYTLTYLARVAGTNEQYLKSHFKSIYGKTVFNYLAEYRMELAKELLRSGDKKISEVAQAVGYRHSTHFTQAFKKHFGYLPLKARGMMKFLAYCFTQWMSELEPLFMFAI